MNAINPLISMAFATYLLAVLAIGVIGYLHTHNLNDYLLGGRRLGRWATALSAGASDMSGWLLLGLPGFAYLAGFEAGWIALGLLAGTALNWYLIATPLRRASEAADNALTIPEFLERRLADRQRLLRPLCALFVLLFFLFYTSAGLVGAGKLFESVFGLSYHWAVLAGAITVLLYTAFGGFLAVVWTDVLQGLLMAVALVVIAVLVLDQTGGWQSLQIAMTTHDPALTDPFRSSDDKTLGWLAILSLLGWGLGYFGQPHIQVRFMAIRHPALIGTARRIALLWTALCMTAALIIGFGGIVLLPEPLTGADSERVYIELIALLLHPVVAGLCLAAILAAIMSTVDSQLLVASSALTEDLFRMLPRIKLTESGLVRVGRLAVVVIALLATWLAMDPDRRVLDLVAYAWAGFGAAFGPTLLMTLYWKRMHSHAAIAGILAGGLTVIVWRQLNGGLFDLYELVPGFCFSLLAILIAGFCLNPGPGKWHIRRIQA